MVKVITYGTYDLLHHGHIRLLERAKALGDYLIVGVTGDDFDRARGKINVRQPLMERVEAVKRTGLADEIIVEEYEGQKIDDIRRLGIDIFTVGSDWTGKFDYLNEYCKVVYLERTQGVSSSDIRSEYGSIKLGIIGDSKIINKFVRECSFVNGVSLSGIYCRDSRFIEQETMSKLNILSRDELIEASDAVYIISAPQYHYEDIKCCLSKDKHVLVESPIAISIKEYNEIVNIAKDKGLVLFDGIKTAYSLAYNRLILLVKSGSIGKVVSIDAVCTSLSDLQNANGTPNDLMWNSICAWGPNAMLPIFDILGTDDFSHKIISFVSAQKADFDLFTKVSFIYKDAIASLMVGQGVKSEGELVISGTKGYVYVPAPWWKTEYFELRLENQSENKRYFYQLEGEGIRYEIVSFVKMIENGRNTNYVSKNVSKAIVKIIDDFYSRSKTVWIKADQN